jgi:hypothetical protein
MQQMDVPFLERRNMIMKKLAIPLLVCLMAFSCSSDDGDSPTGPSEVFQGTFTLQSASATQDGVTVTVGPPTATGTLVVRPDNTYTITTNWPDAGINNETSSGTWTMSGNQITATDNDGTVVTVIVSADQNQLTLTLVEEGVPVAIIYIRA